MGAQCFLDMLNGSLNPSSALASGSLQVDHLPKLLLFSKAFSFNRKVCLAKWAFSRMGICIMSG